MTEIPDDVVDRAKQVIASYNCVGDCTPDFEDCTCRITARAAGRVFVEWEREQCARYMETTLPHLSLQEYAAAIRSRSLPADKRDGE